MVHIFLFFWFTSDLVSSLTFPLHVSICSYCSYFLSQSFSITHSQELKVFSESINPPLSYSTFLILLFLYCYLIWCLTLRSIIPSSFSRTWPAKIILLFLRIQTMSGSLNIICSQLCVCSSFQCIILFVFL